MYLRELFLLPTLCLALVLGLWKRQGVMELAPRLG